jgi:hypothetical protein
MIYNSIKDELGDDIANKLFPEYVTLPNKMVAEKQAMLGKVLMERMDIELSKDDIKKVRHSRCCNIPKNHVEEIIRLKNKYNNIDEILEKYLEFITPGYINKADNIITMSFGYEHCLCGMFRKLDSFILDSKSWCECCNGHVIKIFKFICDKDVTCEIKETITCGGKECSFVINI